MKLLPLKYFCDGPPVYGLNVPAEQYVGSGIRFLRTTDVGNDGRLDPEVSGVFLDGLDVPCDHILRDGDLLFSRSGTLGRSLLFRAQPTPCTHAGYLVRFRLKGHNYPPYLAYCARSTLMQDAIGAEAIESTIGNFNAEKYANVQLPWWPTTTQRAIADFLDRENTRIDALVAAKRRMVELLEERWCVQRDNLVTGRAEPASQQSSLDRQPSRTDWVDKIPTAWRSFPLKYFFSFSKGKNAQRLTQEYVAANRGPYPVYSGQTSQEGVFGAVDSFDFDLPTGAILVSTVGAEAMTPRLVAGRFSLSQNCALLIPRAEADCDLRFMRFQLDPLFAYKRAEIPDHMQPSLRIEDLCGYRVVAPSTEAQRQIGGELALSLRNLTLATRRLNTQLFLLQERRQALITAAVTGQLDIQEQT